MESSYQSRAKQFAPYASLRGFDEVVRERRRVTTPRRELCDDEAEVISARLSSIERGMTVEVEYYLTDSYVKLRGRVAGIDPVFRTVKIGGKTVNFDDVISICIEQSSD